MADIDDAYALGFETPDDAEEAQAVLAGERARRLVHDQDLGPLQQGPGDLDNLTGGDAQLPDRNVQRDLGVMDKAKGFAHFFPHPPTPQKAEAVPLAAQHNVFLDG